MSLSLVDNFQLHKRRTFLNMAYQVSEKEHDFDQISISRSLGLLGLHFTGWILLAEIVNPFGINEVAILHGTLKILSFLVLFVALILLSLSIVNDESRHSRRLQIFFFGAIAVNLCIFFASLIAYAPPRAGSDLPKFSFLILVMIWILQLSVTFALWLGDGLRALHNEFRIIRLSFRWVISDAEPDLKVTNYPHGQHISHICHLNIIDKWTDTIRKLSVWACLGHPRTDFDHQRCVKVPQSLTRRSASPSLMPRRGGCSRSYLRPWIEFIHPGPSVLRLF